MAARRKPQAHPGRRADGTIKRGWYLSCAGRMTEARKRRAPKPRRRKPKVTSAQRRRLPRGTFAPLRQGDLF